MSEGNNEPQSKRSRTANPQRSEAVWQESGLLPTLICAECGGQPGDCLFECVAEWLAVVMHQTPRLTASAVRGLAADELSEDVFDIVNDDIATEENRPLCHTIASLRQRIVHGGVWGCSMLVILLLGALSKLLDEPVGALIVKGADQEPRMLSAWGELRRARVAIVLYHLEDRLHYQLLGDRQRRVIYDQDIKKFVEARACAS